MSAVICGWHLHCFVKLQPVCMCSIITNRLPGLFLCGWLLFRAPLGFVSVSSVWFKFVFLFWFSGCVAFTSLVSVFDSPSSVSASLSLFAFFYFPSSLFSNSARSHRVWLPFIPSIQASASLPVFQSHSQRLASCWQLYPALSQGHPFVHTFSLFFLHHSRAPMLV